MIPEERIISNVGAVVNKFELFNNFSCLHKLQKVRLAQQESFSNDYTKLTESKYVDKKSNLLSLNLILDKNKLMRVGGRIQNSNCSFDKRHPIILPAKHKITYLILRQEHVRLLHCGPTLLLSSIRERFWPISGRNLCKKIRLQQLIQHFWARWHKEYLAELQSRLKWKSEAQNHIKVGTIVLLKEDNAPPVVAPRSNYTSSPRTGWCGESGDSEVGNPGATRGDIDGDLVASGDSDGEKLGDMAVDVVNVAPEASWLMGDLGNIIIWVCPTPPW
ncbi:hypothetical protein NQ318_013434 [Aromia moschata]|uniref:DUF5641 domain-containing protein n=1 Tax=Aromia moschata TaxID=1265417 RepID=A0AAV8YQM9_9CUCU|nr:hypothetical protein NQ318_013434 [Aromia moschata]